MDLQESHSTVVTIADDLVILGDPILQPDIMASFLQIDIIANSVGVADVVTRQVPKIGVLLAVDDNPRQEVGSSADHHDVVVDVDELREGQVDANL